MIGYLVADQTCSSWQIYKLATLKDSAAQTRSCRLLSMKIAIILFLTDIFSLVFISEIMWSSWQSCSCRPVSVVVLSWCVNGSVWGVVSREAVVAICAISCALVCHRVTVCVGCGLLCGYKKDAWDWCIRAVVLSCLLCQRVGVCVGCGLLHCGGNRTVSCSQGCQGCKLRFCP